jgi:hypothetical protein
MAFKTWMATAICPATPPKWLPVTSRSSWFFDQAGHAERAIVEMTEQWDRLFDSDEQLVRTVMIKLGAATEARWPIDTPLSAVASLHCLLSTTSLTARRAPPMVGDILQGSKGELAIYAGRNVIFCRKDNKAHFTGVTAFSPIAIYRFSI